MRKVWKDSNGRSCINNHMYFRNNTCNRYQKSCFHLSWIPVQRIQQKRKLKLLWIGSKLNHITFLHSIKHLLNISIFEYSIFIGSGIPRIWVCMRAESYMCSHEWNIKSEMCARVYFTFLLSRHLSIRSGKKTIYFGSNWTLLRLVR